MVYTNPRVRFTFEDNSVEYADNVVKDSIKITKQILNGLDSSSDTASFVMASMPMYDDTNNITLNGKIVTLSSNILTEIIDGETVLFTGYVSNNRTWTLEKKGAGNLTVNLEGVGVRKLKVPCTKNTYVYRGTVSEVVGYISDVAGVEIADDVPDITKEVYIRMNPTTDCDVLLNDLLKEYGYYYYFDETGKINYAQLNLTNESGEDALLLAKDDSNEEDYGLLRVENGSAITIRRKIGDYKQAQVCFPTVVERTGVSVYAVDGALQIPAYSWFDGIIHDVKTTKPVLARTSINLSRGGTSGSIGAISLSNWSNDVGMVQFKVTVKFEKAYRQKVSGITPCLELRLMHGTEVLSSYAIYGHRFSAYNTNWTSTGIATLYSSQGVTPDSLVLVNMSSRVTAAVQSITVPLATSYGSAKASTTKAVDLEKGKTIWYMDNVVGDGFTITDATNISQPKESSGDTTLSILVDRSNSESNTTISKFAAKADIVATDSEENYVYASRDGAIDAPAVETTYKYSTKYVTDKESAEALSENLAKYYTYCQNTYMFASYEDIPMGSIVRIKDNLFSRIDAKVCVTKKAFVIKKNRETLYSYYGYAVSDISNVITSAEINTSSSPSNEQESKGEYLGASETAPDGNEGDRYFDTTSLTVKVKNNSSWENVSTADIPEGYKAVIIAEAMRDALKYIPEGHYSDSDYDFFDKIIADIVTANYISTKNLDLTNGGSLVSDTVKIGEHLGPMTTSNWSYYSGYIGVSSLIDMCRNCATRPDSNLCSGTVTANGTTLTPTSFTFGKDFLSIKFINGSSSIEFLINGVKKSSGKYKNGVKINGADVVGISSASAIVTVNETSTLFGANKISPLSRWSSDGETSYVGLPGKAFSYGFFDKLYANELLVSPFSSSFPNSTYEDEWSTQLPNGMIMKIRKRAASGTGYNFDTWTFQDAFPNACLFAYATGMKTDAARDSYCYGYPASISKTDVAFAIWYPFDYLCIAIGY